MAQADPEGTAWFEKSSLQASQPVGFCATDPKDFYGHFLLEIVYNHPVSKTWSNSDCQLPENGNERAGENRWNELSHDAMCRYKFFTVMLGCVIAPG